MKEGVMKQNDDVVEIDICCDAFQEALDGGGIRVMEVEEGVIGEVLPDSKGETAILINYCPFCGEIRPGGKVGVPDGD